MYVFHVGVVGNIEFEDGGVLGGSDFDSQIVLLVFGH